KNLDEVAYQFLEGWRQIGLEAAGHDVARHHAHTRARLEDVENLLALAEAVEEDALRAQIERAGAEPDEVAGDALQLGQHDARKPRLLGHVDAQQLLDGERIAKIVAEWREIIHAVGDDQGLEVALILGGLLDAGMQIANVWLRLDDRLAIQREHQPQHAMRRRVLWSHIDGHGVAARTLVELLALVHLKRCLV